MFQPLAIFLEFLGRSFLFLGMFGLEFLGQGSVGRLFLVCVCLGLAWFCGYLSCDHLTNTGKKERREWYKISQLKSILSWVLPINHLFPFHSDSDESYWCCYQFFDSFDVFLSVFR